MPKRGRAPSRVLACAQHPCSAAAARGSKQKSVGLPARHVESLAVTSPDIAETCFAFAVKAWAFEPPPNDVLSRNERFLRSDDPCPSARSIGVHQDW